MTQKRMERKGNSSTVRSHKAGPQVTGVDSNHTQPTTHTHTKPAHRPSNTKQWLPPINHIEVISPARRKFIVSLLVVMIVMDTPLEQTTDGSKKQ
mmetsp:Transcript_32327/g.52389  ORF Transcript_32327/g.52389 Transcript_32327/m.52389 type:complete len:95 (+) Transcript_32327:1225-1509(+)